MQPKPFVKWAGGKRQLVHELLKYSPQEFNNYFEPFFGGGALFFELYSKNKINHAFLNDFNKELITAYKVIKEQPKELIKELSSEKYKADEKTFYKIRENQPVNSIEQTARFIYLNRTAFNGLYRVNSKGQFNVPFGKYKNPKILDKENILAVSEALQKDELTSVDFEKAIEKAKKGDFVYFDPPYQRLEKTASFTKYTINDFTEKDQERLRDCFRKLDKKGCYIMLSNSYTKFILDLYKGYKIHTVMATRLINCKAEKRGKIKEVIITNY
ncbi:MAG: DNA adenine methylase [Candidatus Diapherotrites archaeon]|uniref:site-specific DNA-methyltransferase (adenine-specific) n=1 Tax=Candidatus Iainarchaeum sp. TaxID=3101447 RepID=A0A7K4C0F4_9ARCH|nr:DNA adenine methylase [Candidatus Diapherotrites archaeon]